MISTEQATEIDNALWSCSPIPLVGTQTFGGFCETKVYSKGRPRFNGNSGHAFTPPNTRKFEKTIKEWLLSHDPFPVDHPCSVEITLYDKIPKSTRAWLVPYMEDMLIYSKVGDVDNRAKSIADAANTILFTDDNLVSDLRVKRMYVDNYEGFKLLVRRSGFSMAELDMIEAARKRR